MKCISIDKHVTCVIYENKFPLAIEFLYDLPETQSICVHNIREIVEVYNGSIIDVINNDLKPYKQNIHSDTILPLRLTSLVQEYIYEYCSMDKDTIVFFDKETAETNLKIFRRI